MSKGILDELYIKGSPVHKAPAYAGTGKGYTIWCIGRNLTLFFTQVAVSRSWTRDLSQVTARFHHCAKAPFRWIMHLRKNVWSLPHPWFGDQPLDIGCSSTFSLYFLFNLNNIISCKIWHYYFDIVSIYNFTWRTTWSWTLTF